MGGFSSTELKKLVMTNERSNILQTLQTKKVGLGFVEHSVIRRRFSPLTYAIHKRQAHAVKALVEFGCSVDRGDQHGNTPLEGALISLARSADHQSQEVFKAARRVILILLKHSGSRCSWEFVVSSLDELPEERGGVVVDMFTQARSPHFRGLLLRYLLIRGRAQVIERLFETGHCGPDLFWEEGLIYRDGLDFKGNSLTDRLNTQVLTVFVRAAGSPDTLYRVAALLLQQCGQQLSEGTADVDSFSRLLNLLRIAGYTFTKVDIQRVARGLNTARDRSLRRRHRRQQRSRDRDSREENTAHDESLDCMADVLDSVDKRTLVEEACPSSLRVMCRSVLRKSFKKNVYYGCHRLKLPTPIKDFMLLKDL